VEIWTLNEAKQRVNTLRGIFFAGNNQKIEKYFPDMLAGGLL